MTSNIKINGVGFHCSEGRSRFGRSAMWGPRVPAMSSKCLDRGCAPRPLQGWRGPRSGLGLCRELPRLGRGRRPTRLARAAVRSWELRHELFLPRELLHHDVDSKMTGGGGLDPLPGGPHQAGGKAHSSRQAAAGCCSQLQAEQGAAGPVTSAAGFGLPRGWDFCSLRAKQNAAPAAPVFGP